jgi:hypothetical protein
VQTREHLQRNEPSALEGKRVNQPKCKHQQPTAGGAREAHFVSFLDLLLRLRRYRRPTLLATGMRRLFEMFTLSSAAPNSLHFRRWLEISPSLPAPQLLPNAYHKKYELSCKSQLHFPCAQWPKYYNYTTIPDCLDPMQTIPQYKTPHTLLDQQKIMSPVQCPFVKLVTKPMLIHPCVRASLVCKSRRDPRTQVSISPTPR